LLRRSAGPVIGFAVQLPAVPYLRISENTHCYRPRVSSIVGDRQPAIALRRFCLFLGQ
jgi:hypothetical protein